MNDTPLRLDRVQGNVVPGFVADAQALLALRIVDPAAARSWLAALVPDVTTGAQVYACRAEKSFAGPWLNVALSHAGLTALLGTEPGLTDEAFTEGLAARSALLGDDGHPEDWVVGSPSRPVHVLVIVAGSPQAVSRKARQVLLRAAESGLVQVWSETGTRLGERGAAREHFGFRDGVSEPAVRGLPGGSEPFRVAPDGPQYASPGAPLIHAGAFVFGYPRQHPSHPVRPWTPASAGPQWTDDGSYLVFRRLRQDVDRFEEFLAREGERVAEAMGWAPRAAAESLGAFLVGRWKSGAPVIRGTANGRPDNDFDFTDPPDPLGLACPGGAHIRKVNPRTGHTDQGGPEDTLTRRILRRGMPYGPPHRAGDGKDRGLHFLCFQTSIVEQFEFLTRIWSNSPSAPRGGGMDLLIGQCRGGMRAAYLHGPDGRQVTVSTAEAFVVPTGGEYLFAPSTEGLRGLAEGKL
ncbi:peroxidase [Virgisporangium aliadipatigenens]|uniref:Peroxidase n=1 Tax=Virgisporangium aliadipatigenens TaxID=741659 RepID=A0A8J3YE14_9ACTN|nr:Dyp-type peroxidase [Virgisporangium aliadipatigenens]GIJ43409.1 peroxidase [Virgisporangium aliadipatigenens]